MADFRPAFEAMIVHEGGFVDDPADKGGRTKWGISQRSYPDLDIASLTQEDAAQIYHRDYWQPKPYGLIINQRVASKVFDMAVNMGFLQAHVLTQRACNELGKHVVADGQLGPLSIQAINECDPDFLLDALRYQARHFYMTLAANKPSNQKFLKGWIRRADS
jgi:lysozyme family protein